MLRSRQYLILVILFAISLLIRLAFLIPMTSNSAVELGDARGYFERAVGFENILDSLLEGDKPSSQDLAQAYTSRWPPLQSFLLSLGFVVFGHSLLVGRLMVIGLSTLTTPLVYLVTKKLSNDRVAFLAAVISAIYPSFIHYSLRLFSETTYIFLFFLMFYCALLTVEAMNYKKAGLLAAATGCLLGLATLTRATGLAWIPVVAIWIGWRSVEFRKRLLIPVLVLISAGLTLLPWQVIVFAVEGRAVMVTSVNDATLNSWLPNGDGAAAEYSQQRIIDIDEAYREWYRTWLPDFALYRYLLALGYPPMSTGWLSLIFVVMLISFCLFLGLALWGLFNPTPALRYRELVVALLLVTLATYIIMHGQPRYSIPLLAVLLPVAGHGLAYLRVILARTNWPWAIATLISIVIMGWSIYTGLPYEYSRMSSSSQYLNFARQLDHWLGHDIMVRDRLLFRTNGDNYPHKVAISIVGSDFEFANSGTQIYTWNPSLESRGLDLVVQSQTATKPLQLQLTSGQSGQSAVVSLNREAWYTWQPAGLPGIEYMWVSNIQNEKREFFSE